MAKQSISGAEVKMNQLETHAKSLELKYYKWILQMKMDELQCQSYRNSLRLIGLPEKEEGQDICIFLKSWVPKVLSMDMHLSPLIIYSVQDLWLQERFEFSYTENFN